MATAGSAAGILETRLDRTQVTLGETVQLSIKAEGKLSGEPDTTPLEKDFDVLGSSRGSSINIINGSMSSSTTWEITLQPKKEGTLTIPSLEIDALHTDPLALKVSSSPSLQADAGSDIFIETELGPDDPYERQQVIYTIRLFVAVKLAEGNISAPQPQNTIVQQLGDDRTYETTRNNRRYQVIERSYALFPQQAGNLTIDPPVFDGKEFERNRRRNPIDPFFDRDALGMFANSVKPVRIIGQEVSLTVRPRPQSVDGLGWLPADSVSLSEEWRPEANSVKAGEAITRTITITAGGQDGASLPELTPGGMDGFRIYPDKAEVKADPQHEGISGSRQQKIAFIPVRPGTFTLPEISLQWWDTKEDRMQVASLPTRTVTVLPGENQFVGAQPPPPEKRQQAKTGDTAPSVGKGESQILDVAQAPVASSFLWQTVALVFGAGWFSTLLFWWRDRRKRKKSGTPPVISQRYPDRARQDYRGEFLSACKSGNAGLARSALLQWSAILWPEDPPKGLSELAQRIDDPASVDAISELDRFLYGGNAIQWDGRKLASLLQHISGKSNRKSIKKTPLPPLYP